VDQRGPKGPSKLTPELAARCASLRAEGRSLLEVASAVGVSTDTVRRALAAQAAREAAAAGPAANAGPEPVAGTDLVPLARPEPRGTERALAHAGLLSGATPVITEGASLPFAGALMVLPALAVTGLLEVAHAVYGIPKAAFYGVRSLLLTLVFAALLGEPRAEGLTRIDPQSLGRLLGLDRAPEVGTMRRRMEALAGLRRSDAVVMGLARHHVGAHPEAMGILYVDGHVRAYHGGADLSRTHLARARIAMAATTDTWLADARGDAVLVWSSVPGASLAGELKEAARVVRGLLGPDARPTICFDRGGWSPATFVELVAEGFHILTYKKGPLTPEPADAFTAHQVRDSFGHPATYLLADRRVTVSYDKGRLDFSCRQVTRRDEASGHQTQVLTTRADLEVTEVAQAMFGRWREENLFRFMRPRGLDAMDSYAKVPDDLTRLVPNPAKAKARQGLADARGGLSAAKAAVASEALATNSASAQPISDARNALAEMKERAADIPAKVALGTIRPDAMVLDDERKRIHDATRMAAWNAEHTLARALGAHYARAEDEAHSLLAEAFSASADMEIVGEELHVRIEPLSSPRRSRAIAALCSELTATMTTYPGTDLRLVYSVKAP
ncbi:MAG: putative transposase, partial [Actinomycetes bacterium]